MLFVQPGYSCEIALIKKECMRDLMEICKVTNKLFS